jgi:hypothetical protein
MLLDREAFSQWQEAAVWLEEKNVVGTSHVPSPNEPAYRYKDNHKCAMKALLLNRYTYNVYQINSVYNHTTYSAPISDTA